MKRTKKETLALMSVRHYRKPEYCPWSGSLDLSFPLCARAVGKISTTGGFGRFKAGQSSKRWPSTCVDLT